MPSPKNWIKTDNVAGQWNTLVTDTGALLSAVLVSNSVASAITIQVRLATLAGVPLATILPAHEVTGYGADVLNLRSLSLTADQQLQIYTSIAGLHAVATGVL